MRRRLIACTAFIACAQLIACRMSRAGERSAQPAAEIRVDSAQYTVRLASSMFRVDIPYTYTNHSGGTVSQRHCNTPTPPLLEKRLSSDRWVRAYNAIELLCESSPPFRIADGKTYRDVLHVVASAPGRNTDPEWQVDSIPGTYRLHWVLHAGADPTARGGMVSATSASFRLIVR